MKRTVNYNKSGRQVRTLKAAANRVDMNLVIVVGLFGAAMWLRVAYLVIQAM